MLAKRDGLHKNGNTCLGNGYYSKNSVRALGPISNQLRYFPKGYGER